MISNYYKVYKSCVNSVIIIIISNELSKFSKSKYIVVELVVLNRFMLITRIKISVIYL